MPIKISCKCGQSFMAKDELAGQTLLCPKCHEPITITAATSSGKSHAAGGSILDLLDEVGLKESKGPRCPQCTAPMSAHAVLCVKCGYNIQTKQVASQAAVRKAGERGHVEVTAALMDSAAQRIDEDRLEERKNRSQGMPAWVYFLAFAGLAAFCASMFMIPKERAFMITGFVVVGAGWLGGVYYNIRIIIVAFMESVACGLLSLFIPLYILYYIFTRWDRCGGFFLMSLVMGAVSGLGWIFVAAAPLMADKEESAAWLLVPPAWVVEADEDIMGRIRV